MNKQITVTSPLLPDLGEFNEFLMDIWNRKWITNMGEYHKRLEKELAEYLHVPYELTHVTGGPVIIKE